MGANHVGEIAFLCELANPTHGLITNIGKAHLEGFGGIEGVKKGKGELYDYLRLKNGIAFVNYQSSILMSMSKGLEIIPYLDDDKYTMINVSDGELIRIKDESGDIMLTNLVGSYNFNNIVAAIRLGQFFDVNENDIKKAISSYEPTNNRSQIIVTKNNRVLLDAYNANPTSVEAALMSFSLAEKNNKVIILGDMFELGDYSSEEHLKILKLTVHLGFFDVRLCGKEFYKIKGEYQGVSFYSTKNDLESDLLKRPIQGKNILIKGSRGIGLETILPLL